MSKPTAERRFIPTEVGEVRIEARDDGPPVLVGMAPPYESWSPIRGDMRERFSAAAFRDSTEDVIATVEHDNAKIFGRLSAGTLQIEDREDGAYYRVELGDRSYERDLAESVRRREILGSSFEFFTLEDDWEQADDGVWNRTVLRAQRVQVGPVARPFYDDSTAAIRSLAAAQIEVIRSGRGFDWFRRRNRHLRKLVE